MLYLVEEHLNEICIGDLKTEYRSIVGVFDSKEKAVNCIKHLASVCKRECDGRGVKFAQYGENFEGSMQYACWNCWIDDLQYDAYFYALNEIELNRYTELYGY